MSSQSSLTTRRQFLERSAWGFGSAFILPSLLTSCMTDHNLPGPDSPITTPPLLGDAADDVNNDLRNAVTSGLQLIPDVGGFVGSLVSIFWPTEGDSPWDQVKAQVQALIEQNDQQLVLTQQQTHLDALKDVLNKYYAAVNAVDWDSIATSPWPIDYENSPLGKNLAWVQSEWTAVDTQFGYALPFFQMTDYQTALLPLFAQVANLYLAFYRDPLLPARDSKQQPILGPDGKVLTNGQLWNMSDGQIDLARNTLVTATALIADPTDDTVAFMPYVTKYYNQYLDKLKQREVVLTKNEPFKTANAFTRSMTMNVLDFMDAWQYYDFTKYPNGAKNSDGTNIPLFTREIYSDPYGNVADAPGIVLPKPATQFPIQIAIWGGDRIDAVQLTYPDGGGPGGVTQTNRMGDKKGGSTTAPHGGILNLPPGGGFLQASVTYTGDDPNAFFFNIQTLQFMYVFNGVLLESELYGGLLGGGQQGEYKSDWVGYPNYALSSIYIHGSAPNHPNTSADCIVFGFLRQR